jgi:MtN3 and saliva related transmembrane protein
MDQNVSLTMNIFLIIGNVVNIIYNLPQIVKTYKTKSTSDFSEWFLFLRIFGNIIWVAYAIEVESMLMLINNIVTVLSSIFIGYYKVIELYNKRKKEPEYDEKVNGDSSKKSTYFIV